MKGKVPSFALKLMQLLQQESVQNQWIVQWTFDGTAFEIHDIECFTRTILPKYFGKQTKYKSFQRQLHYFGFRKWTKTMTSICTYSHPYFQRDALDLLVKIQRKKRVRAKRTQDFLDDILHFETNIFD